MYRHSSIVQVLIFKGKYQITRTPTLTGYESQHTWGTFNWLYQHVEWDREFDAPLN